MKPEHDPTLMHQPDAPTDNRDDSKHAVTAHRKSALVSRQSRSRAATSPLKVKLNNNKEGPLEAAALPRRADRNSVRDISETPLNSALFHLDPFPDVATPLRSGNYQNYPPPQNELTMLTQPAFHPVQKAGGLKLTATNDNTTSLEDPVSLPSHRRYHTDVGKMRRALETQLNAVWLTEVIGDIAIRYYQGQREGLIAPLTQVTVVAETYDLKVLMARAQLWKALVFDDLGNVNLIPTILVDIFRLVRDHGDEMDCYHLRKLFPYYGELVWQHLMKTAEVKRNDSNATFTSQASRGAFEGWFSSQVLSLEKRYDHRVWPDPFMARNSALASSKLGRGGLQISANDVSGNTTLIRRMMRLEDELFSEKERYRRMLQELIDENKALRAAQFVSSVPAPAPAPVEDEYLAQRASAIFSPGQVTAMMEELKKAKPRARRRPTPSGTSAHWSSDPTKRWVQEVSQVSPADAAHPNISRTPSLASLHTFQSRYDRGSHGVLTSISSSNISREITSARPSPLRIRKRHQEPTAISEDGNRRSTTRAQTRSSLMKRTVPRKTPPQTPEKLIPPHSPSRIPVATPEGKFTTPRPDHALFDLATSVTPHPRIRRGSSVISPLTIDPAFELASTDTPSPTKLRNTFPKLEEHQKQQRRRSLTVLASPHSTSYETERRRSQVRAGLSLAGLDTKGEAAPTENPSHETQPTHETGNNRLDRQAKDMGNTQSHLISVQLNPSSAPAERSEVKIAPRTQRRNESALIKDGHRPIADAGSISSSLSSTSPNNCSLEAEPSVHTHVRKNSVPIIPSPLRRTSHVGEIVPQADNVDRQQAGFSINESQSTNTKLSTRSLQSETSDLYGVSPQSLSQTHDLPPIDPASDALVIRGVLQADDSIPVSPKDSAQHEAPVRLSYLLEELTNDYIPADETQSERMGSSNSLMIEPLGVVNTRKPQNLLSELRSALAAEGNSEQPESWLSSMVSVHHNEMQLGSEPATKSDAQASEDAPLTLSQEFESLHYPPNPFEGLGFQTDSSKASSKETTKSGISEARTENYDVREDQVPETLLPLTYVPGSTPPNGPSPQQSKTSKSSGKSDEVGENPFS